MSVTTATRWVIAIAWLVCAFLLERILTLGTITDASQATRNPTVVVGVCVALFLIAVAIAIAILLDADRWAPVSLALGVAYAIGGAWLALAHDHDSGGAIVGVAVLIGIASWKSLDGRP